MRKWFAGMALASGLSVVLAGGASSQQAIQIQVQAQPAIQIQAAPPIQVQAQVFQIQGNAAIANRAIAVAPMPGGARFAQADAIVVGRVVAFEPMDVQAAPAAGQGKVNYRIAVVQVTKAIFGVKKDTQTIRIGFIAPAVNGPNGGPGAVPPGAGVQILPAVQPAIQIQPAFQPGGFGRRPFPGMAQMTLQIGQDGMFTLNKHATEKFYLAPNFNAFVNRQNNPNFDNDVKTASQLAKVMGNPAASLKSTEKQDRYLAAAVLINRYRMPANPTGQPMKQVQVDAEESKLILKALAEGDWTNTRYNAAVPNPFELFNQVGITQRDGYNPVNIRTQQDIATAMQKWLDENNGKYRVSKLVIDPNGKVQPGINQPGIDLPVRPGIRPGIRPLPPQRIQPGKVQILPAPVPVPLPAVPQQADRATDAPPPVQALPPRQK